MGWIGLPKPSAPYLWGSIDAEAYDYYSDPLNADMHELVPGRLFAVRTPKDLGGREYLDM